MQFIVKKITPKNGNSRRMRKTSRGNIKTLLTCFVSLIAIFSLIGSYSINAMSVIVPSTHDVAYAPLNIRVTRWGDYTSNRYSWMLEDVIPVNQSETIRDSVTYDGTSSTFQQNTAYRGGVDIDGKYNVVYMIGGINNTLGEYDENTIEFVYSGYLRVNDYLYNNGISLNVNTPSVSVDYTTLASLRVVRSSGDTAEGYFPYTKTDNDANGSITVVPSMATLDTSLIYGDIVYIEGTCTIRLLGTYRNYSVQMSVPYEYNSSRQIEYHNEYNVYLARRALEIGEATSQQEAYDKGFVEGRLQAYNELSDLGSGSAGSRRGFLGTVLFVFECCEQILSVEILPGFTIGTIVTIFIGLALVGLFLKLYAGG